MTSTRLKSRFVVLTAICLAFTGLAVWGQEPPARTTYMGRRIAPTMSYKGAGWLIRAERQKEEDCATLLKELRLQAGMTVCDMGCGNGYYALQIAEQVGSTGKVLGVDIQPEMLRLLQARAEEQGQENIQPILGKIYDPMLPSGKVDLILCVDVYHEFSHPEHMLKAMRQSLSPNGVVVLAEYREEDPRVPILPLHKMSKKQVMKELNANGFELVREFDGLPWQHLMFFGRDDRAGHSPNTDDILLADFEGDTTKIEEYRLDPRYYKEKYRPTYHFTPEVNWMNDPNGLVYFEGEYHLFYQHNPFGNSWGHMSWGHAVSTDLVHWKHLPIALYHENDVMIFSGCCVIDWNNTSGFGKGGIAPMVAVYTGHGLGKQTQRLAYSNDRGRSWTKYALNPVLDLNEKDFRDPKVFWHEPTRKWVMVVSLAVEKRLQFYGSTDLKKWKLLSEFGPAGVKKKPNWECPDLFELPIEGEVGKTKWVLEVDMGGGAIAGGSGGEYFIGEFDGTRFECDHGLDEVHWVDYGRDFYAPVSWSDIPRTDGRRIWIGWMNNWETNQVPTTPWRRRMSIPRTLSLRRTQGGFRLIQRPVAEVDRLARPFSARTNISLKPGSELSYAKAGTSLKILARFRLGDAGEVGIRVRKSDSEQTVVGYETAQQKVFVDRTHSGEVDFHASFAGRHAGPLPSEDGVVTLLIFVDSSSVEVFGNDGYTVITERIFPDPSSQGMQVYAKGGNAVLERLEVWQLQRAMP